jgi:hypothetical protein
MFKDKQKKKKREENEVENSRKKMDQSLTSSVTFVLTMMPDMECFKRIRGAMHLRYGGKMAEMFMSKEGASPEPTPPAVAAEPKPDKPGMNFELWSKEREIRKRKEKMMKKKFRRMKRSLNNAVMYRMEMESMDEMDENRKWLAKAIMEVRKNIGERGDMLSDRDIAAKIMSRAIRMDRRSRK